MNTNELTVRAVAHATYDNATREYTMDYSRPLFVELSIGDFDTREDAEAAAALFPKSAKFSVVECRHAGGVVTYSAHSRASLYENGINKGVNETGIKRYRSTVARAEKLSMPVVFTSGGVVNAYAERESFESAIA